MLLNDLKDLIPIESKKLNVGDKKHKITKKKSENYSVEKRGKLSKKSKHSKKVRINNKDSVGVASSTSNDKNDKIYDTNELNNVKNNPKDTDVGSDILISKEVNWSDESSKINKRDKLELKLPNVLNKFLSLVMRKSMVSLNSGTHCKPGTITKVECNTCYCLVNGRMLCTKNIC